jgi:predicted alpha/beta hydrolase family esterase
LADRLVASGYTVDYPQLPEPDRPSLKDWLGVVEEHLRQTATEELTVICHSLGCMAWMHLSDQGSPYLPVRRLLFVAPPGRAFLARTPELSRFLPPSSGHTAVAKSVTTPPRLACADDDPYCLPERADQVYRGVFDVDLVPDAGHFDIPAGYGAWPKVLEWCENPDTRLVPAG